MDLAHGTTGTPAAGWYPDPAGSGMLRYWDGSVWTGHLAPAAAPTPISGPQHPPVQPPHRKPRRPPHEWAWTTGTLVTLIVCALLVVATVPALAWLASAKTQALEGGAQGTIEKFLAAATTGDPAWRDVADPALHPEMDDSATPLYGDIASAEQLDLTLDYRYDPAGFDYVASETSYVSGEPRTADAVAVPVELTYTYSVDGESFTSELTQAVWLTRPFYYGGSDEPSAADASRTPSAVGPWRVAGIAAGSTNDFDVSGDEFATTFSDAATESDEGVCAEPKSMILEMSQLSRQDGMLSSSCLLRQGDARLRPDDLDPQTVAAEFPVMNEFSAIPDDVMGTEVRSDALPPLSQYPIAMGDTEYVFTIAATPSGGAGVYGQTLRFIQVAEVAGE